MSALFSRAGRVAACVSTVNAYQNRYYFYADDRQNTLLCALDEHAVGFAVDHSGAPRVTTFPLFAKRVA